MSSIRIFVRGLVHAYRRVAAVVAGPNEYHWKRLVRSGRVVIGPGTYGIPEIQTYVHGTERLIVGNYSSLGGTYILGGKHSVDNVTTYPHRILRGMPGAGEDGYPTFTGDVIVGSDAWTCQKSVIISGLTIGHGAVIAAGAVVTKDVPPYAVVAGNPAKIVKYRFTEEQRTALLDIAWWDWPEDEVVEAIPYLSGNDIDAFIAYARSKRS